MRGTKTTRGQTRHGAECARRLAQTAPDRQQAAAELANRLRWQPPCEPCAIGWRPPTQAPLPLRLCHICCCGRLENNGQRLGLRELLVRVARLTLCPFGKDVGTLGLLFINRSLRCIAMASALHFLACLYGRALDRPAGARSPLGSAVRGRSISARGRESISARSWRGRKKTLLNIYTCSTYVRCNSGTNPGARRRARLTAALAWEHDWIKHSWETARGDTYDMCRWVGMQSAVPDSVGISVSLAGRN